MKKISLTLAALALTGTAAFSQKAASIQLKTKNDSVSYALGVLVGKNLKSQGFDVIDLEKFNGAIKEVFENKTPSINEMQAQTVVQSFAQAQQKAKGEKALKEGQAFLEKNKAKKGVVTTASGLQYEVLTAGPADGPKPGPTSEITAHYHGTLLNGNVFDSSIQKGKPLKIGVNQVIKGWQEALQLMTPGTKLRIWVPSEIGYGERGMGQMIGPNEVLVFEMELLSIDKP